MELIGRDGELASVLARLDGHRLVTVVGPGGIGKTSLARTAAAQVGPDYPLGAHFVDLTRVDSAEAVGGAIAAQLGFPSFAAFVTAPADQPALLVIDNCEHVIDAAAHAIDELLAACDAPTVLATSRSPLDLPGESVVVLGPLAVPDRDAVDTDVASMRLFLERAQDAGASTAEFDPATLAELCRAVDGIPLALELAAARTRVMAPAEIVARLADPDTLSRPRYRGAQRHRSLRATTTWSYDLLTADQQRVFDRLGVIAGPFGADLAHAVSAEPGDPPVTTLTHLTELVAASLIATEPARAAIRYRQLETLRTFALEHLDERGEAEEARERFADHVQQTALTLVKRSAERWDETILIDLMAEYDHLSAALRWSIAHDTGPDRALLLLAVLWGVITQGYVQDVAALGEETFARWPEPTSGVWADAAATVATTRYLLGDPEAAIRLVTLAMPLAEGSISAPCTLPRVLGQARVARGDAEGALAAFLAGAEAAEQRHHGPLAMELRVFAAQVRADLGDVDGALSDLRAVQAQAAAAGSILNDVWARTTEGFVLLASDVDTARRLITDTLARCRQMDYTTGCEINLRSLALTAVRTGDHAEAAMLLREMLDTLLARGAISELRPALHAIALLLEQRDHPSWPDLAATAAALPIVSMLAVDGRALPATGRLGRVLSTPDAIAVSQRALADVAVGVDVAEPTPSAATASNPEGVFTTVGEFWELTFAGRTVNLRPSKGMSDLARLLATPGREVHCLELAGAGTEQSSTGAAIDDTARRQYEQRIRGLQLEIDEAEAHHDRSRAERAQLEFDALVEQLASALGLGGRARRQGDTTERARSAVTQRIRATIKRIGAEHPELGRHLAASVATGTFCSYRPERETTWKT